MPTCRPISPAGCRGKSDKLRLNAQLRVNNLSGFDFPQYVNGAGGVGGLLMVQEGGNSYLPAYDAMGNVHGMIKASDGSLAAAYEYDAFGNTLRESGTYAASNPFRFATKYADTETGLVQYNTRYYSPTLGRFLNRDPIGEVGGHNLYAFVGNNGVNRWDYLGMVAQDQYISVPGDDPSETIVIMGNRGSFVGWADGYAFTKEAGDNFSATGFKETRNYLATIWTQAFVAKVVDSGETVFVKDKSTGAVYAVGKEAATYGRLASMPTDIPSPGQFAPDNTAGGSIPDWWDEQFAIDTDPSRLLANKGRGAPPPRGSQQVRVGNGGLFSGGRPTPGGPWPLPNDLEFRPASGEGLARSVGTPGSNNRIRLVDTVEALKDLFRVLTGGGTPVPGPYPRYRVPDGGEIQLRPTSSPRSGGLPTIDYFTPGGPVIKIHVPPPPPTPPPVVFTIPNVTK